MPKITIPKTVAQAKKALSGVGQLLTAKEWERAAIVYAFTMEGHRRAARNRTVGSDVSTTEEFAGLGIVGLLSPGVVRQYRTAWQTAIDKYGAKPVTPGDTVVLPTEDFPDSDYRVPRTAEVHVKAALKRDPKVLTKIIYEGGDEMEDAVADALVADPFVAMRVQQKVHQRQAAAPPKPPMSASHWAKVLRAVTSAHSRADGEMRDLARDLNPEMVYASQIEDVIKHLTDDVENYLPQLLAKFRAMLKEDDTTTNGHRPTKNVTPVKELA